MIRNDKLTIKRFIETQEDGEWVQSSTPETVYSNKPCHLSVRALNDVNQSQSTGILTLDFKLFFDNVQKLELKTNDIAEVTTSQGEFYTLYVGEGFKYPLTSQYQLLRDKIV